MKRIHPTFSLTWLYSRLWADLRYNGRFLSRRSHHVLLHRIPSRAVHPFLLIFCDHGLCLLVFGCHCLYLFFFFFFRNAQHLLFVIIIIIIILAIIHNIRLTISKPLLFLLQSLKILFSLLTLLFLRRSHTPFLRRASHRLHRFRIFEQFLMTFSLFCGRDHSAFRIQCLIEAECFLGVPDRIVGRVCEDGVQAGSVEASEAWFL
jgi:hypothetical protein